MAGNSVSVLIYRPLIDEEKDRLYDWLRSISRSFTERVDFFALYVKPGNTLGEGIPGDADCGELWLEFGSPQADEVELISMESCLGFLPEYEIELSSSMSGKLNTMVLGQVAMGVADLLCGWINLPVLLAPPTINFDGDLPDTASLSNIFRPYVNSMPGKICEVPYLSEGGSYGLHHIVDREFFRAWLNHLHYHL